MTKEELKRATYISKDIDRLKERIEQLESEVTRVTQQIKFAPSATSNDNYLKEILIDLKIKMENKLAQIIEQKIMIENFINEIDDPLARLIIYYRYVDMLSWRDVAQKVGGNNTEDSCRMMVNRYLDLK